LLEYQLRLRTPQPPEGSFDRQAARRGRRLFNNEAGCATCHPGPTYTDVLRGPKKDAPFLHDPSETGMDPVYAGRSVTGQYRATPLRALWQHAPYFHDGSAPDLPAVVEHYDQHFGLNLTDDQKADLVEFLKSL
jgi:cytochrome c peroxidase